jgi:hypothetical protein
MAFPGFPGYPQPGFGQGPQPLRWLRAVPGQREMNGGYLGGTDHNNVPLFVARIRFEGGVQPGKWSGGMGNISFPYGGKEISGNSEFEVLEMNSSLSWQYCINVAEIPGNAVQTGNEADGKPLYSSRADINGTKQVGKVGRHFSPTGGCSIGYGGKENNIAPFEVLIQVLSQPGYPQPGYPQPGYPGPGYPQPGYPQPGYPGQGFVRNPPRFVQRFPRQPINCRAVEGGLDAPGQPLIVIRAPYEGGLHPGKYNRSRETCYFAYGGKEISVEAFEILEDSGDYAWFPCNNINEVPYDRAVPIGNESDGKVLYAARGIVSGNFHIGKAGRHIGGGASIGYFGKELFVAPFEVLVYKF